MMQKFSVLAIATGISLTAWSLGRGDEANTHLQAGKRVALMAPGQAISPASDPICAFLKPSVVLRLDLKGSTPTGGAALDLLHSLSGALTCAQCVTYYSPNSAGNDDTGPSLGAQGTLSFPGTIVQTPFDIDLSSQWDATKMPVILLKVILDDASVSFYRPPGAANANNSSWALVPAGANTNMFLCRGDISRTTVGNLEYVTVKVKQMPASGDGSGVFGGLNIGILVPQKGGSLPVYFDPNVKNNG